jgi:CcmD family protein
MKTAVAIIWIGIVLVLLPELVSAQAGLPDPQALANQSLRGYTHMFVAYAIAWCLIMGWAVSIARRLGALEKALKD